MSPELQVGTLSGRIVRLEPARIDHADALLAAANEDRATYDWTAVPQTREQMTAYVRELIDGDDVAFVQVRQADDRVVGCTRFLTIRYRGDAQFPYAVEIGGTWLGSSAQRSGINVEAKLLLLTHAFDGWGVGRVDFKTDARNVRSRDAIAALGATFEGVLRNWQPSHARGEDGQLRDSAIFSITDREWPKVYATLEARLTR